jgi:hypothetical protein
LCSSQFRIKPEKYGMNKHVFFSPLQLCGELRPDQSALESSASLCHEPAEFARYEPEAKQLQLLRKWISPRSHAKKHEGEVPLWRSMFPGSLSVLLCALVEKFFLESSIIRTHHPHPQPESPASPVPARHQILQYSRLPPATNQSPAPNRI